jgi:hypothetical protein
MKPLAARACARPLTAPSTMTLLDQPDHASAPSTAGSAAGTVAFVGGLLSRHFYLDSLVGSLAARPIASLDLGRQMGVDGDRELTRRTVTLCGFRAGGSKIYL